MFAAEVSGEPAREACRGQTHQNLVVDALEAGQALLRVVGRGASLLPAGATDQPRPLEQRRSASRVLGRQVRMPYKVHGSSVFMVLGG